MEDTQDEICAIIDAERRAMQLIEIKNFIKGTIFYRLFAGAYHTFLYALETVGNIGFNLKDVFVFTIKGKADIKKVLYEAARIGVDALPLVIMISWLAGMIISLQLATEMVKQGAGNFVGAFVTLVMLKELGPIMAAFAITFMEGSSIAAEIASMKVTEQVDAIKTMNVNPVGYYFTPKIISAAITTPMVVLIAELCGILAGMVIANETIGLHFNRYMNTVWLWLNTKDIYISLLKASIFGIVITTVTATQGYETKGGAVDVGNAVTQSAIKATICILLADFIINLIFYL